MITIKLYDSFHVCVERLDDAEEFRWTSNLLQYFKKHLTSSSWRLSRRVSFAHLNTSAGMPSIPGAFQDASLSMAFPTSSVVGVSSSSVMHGRGSKARRASYVTVVSR